MCDYKSEKVPIDILKLIIGLLSNLYALAPLAPSLNAFGWKLHNLLLLHNLWKIEISAR